MGKFKVGDKVRLTEDYSKWVAGTESVIEQILAGDSGDDDLIYTDTVRGAFARRFELVPVWQPKVGDRVLMKPDSAWACDATVGPGTVFPAEKEGRFIVKFDVDNGFPWNVSVTDIEPLPVATEAQLAPLAEAPAWTPKVGDRVRLVKDGRSTTGAVGKTATISSWVGGVLVDTDEYLLDIDPPVDYKTAAATENFTRATIDCFEPLLAASTPTPLTITAGRYYKTRDGRKVGPVVIGKDTAWGETSDGSAWVFTATGRANYEGEHPDDYVAEWVDEPAEQPAVAVATSNDNAAPAKFKVGDRVKITATDWPEYISIGEVLKVVKVDDDGFYPLSRDGHDWLYFYFSEGVLAGSHPPTAIVALIENGQPKPSVLPHVHATEAAAAKEAERLASVHKGQQFGVYVLTTTSQEPAPTYGHEWQRLAVAGRRIDAIKELRSVTGMQLKPAKDVVEHFVNYPYGQLAA